jgi:hypothetical protein
MKTKIDPRYSHLYQMAQDVPLKIVRSLKTGDVIDAFYKGSEEPVRIMLTQVCETSKTGDYRDLCGIPLTQWGTRKAGAVTKLVNTPRFRKVGRMEFVSDEPVNPNCPVQPGDAVASHIDRKD